MSTGPLSPTRWWPGSLIGRACLLVAVLLVAVACTESGETSTTAIADTTTPTEGTGGLGRLVILDADGNVAVVDPDGSNLETITDDAGQSALHSQPLWSPDASTLVWGRATETGFSVVLHDVNGGESRSVTTANMPFYISWSPDGSHLGVLHNGDTGIDFNLVDVEGATIMRVDTGAPYYFSWRPDGEFLVTHVGEDRVETIDPAGNRTPGQPTSPAYLSPQWTDAGIFHVADDALILEDDSGSRQAVATVEGAVFFVASPDGSRVAVQTTGGGDDAFEVALSQTPAAPSASVVIIDVTTGSVETVSDEPALGFFWSTDGSSLLALIPGETSLEPVVWRDGDVTEYSGYIPPGTMLQDTFPFFPQYAQSVAFWAPDSSAFAYAGAIDDEVGIWVQHLDSDTPVKIADGRWVAWSS